MSSLKKPRFSFSPFIIYLLFIFVYAWLALTKRMLSRWHRYKLQARKWGTISVSSTDLTPLFQLTTTFFLSLKIEGGFNHQFMNAFFWCVFSYCAYNRLKMPFVREWVTVCIYYLLVYLLMDSGERKKYYKLYYSSYYYYWIKTGFRMGSVWHKETRGAGEGGSRRVLLHVVCALHNSQMGLFIRAVDELMLNPTQMYAALR